MRNEGKKISEIKPSGVEWLGEVPEYWYMKKLFAIRNNPERKFKDFYDIREILQHTEYNKNVFREYFKKHGQESYFEEIAGKTDESK